MIKLKSLILENQTNEIPSFEEIWKEIRRSDGFKNEFEFFKSEMEDQADDQIEAEIRNRQELRYDEIISNYEYLNGELCWRVITVPKTTDIKSIKNLGIFWSTEQSKASAHWGKFGQGYIKIILEATIDEKNIDWRGTMFSRMDMSIGDEEAEVRFFPNKKIFLNRVYMNNVWYDVNQYRLT